MSASCCRRVEHFTDCIERGEHRCEVIDETG